MSERGSEAGLEQSLYQEYDHLMNITAEKLVGLVVAVAKNPQLSDRDTSRIREFSRRRENILEVWMSHGRQSKSNTEKIQSYHEIIPMLKELIDDMDRFKTKKLK